MAERYIRDMFLNSDEVQDEWSSHLIQSRLDSQYISKIRSNWNTLEPWAKMRYLLACICADFSQGSGFIRDVKHFVDDNVQNEDMDLWVAPIAGLSARRIFGDNSQFPQLQQALYTTVQGIIDDSLQSVMSVTENSTETPNYKLDLADDPYFRPFELQYMHPNLQPPMEVFENRHFLPAPKATPVSTAPERQHLEMWRSQPTPSINSNSDKMPIKKHEKKTENEFKGSSLLKKSDSKNIEKIVMPKKRPLVTSTKKIMAEKVEDLLDGIGSGKKPKSEMGLKGLQSVKSSKMVMIDVEEVKRLHKVENAAETTQASVEKKVAIIDEEEFNPFAKPTKNPRTASKRGRGPAKAPRKEKLPPKTGTLIPDSSENNESPATALLMKSNRLSPDERSRVILFFEGKNPTPDQLEVKLKLHEEVVGEARETMYLILDYTAMQWRKTRKLKQLD